LRTDDLDYGLPSGRIALEPAEPRDQAKLLIDQGPGLPPRDGVVTDVGSLVRPGDVVVLNDTRVLRARLPVRRASGGAGEVLFLSPAGVDHRGWWEALVRPARKLHTGDVLAAAADPSVEVEVGDDLGEGRRLVRPPVEGDDLARLLDRVGEVPLPPYLAAARLDDPERYQTVYSRRPASAAAPTAGLHLTDALLDAVRAAGATVVRVELVVGLGTFRPISTDRVEDHVMHEERYDIAPEVWEQVRAARRVVAVGTTSVRALETAAATDVLSGESRLFIKRPYPWAVVDVLMTNFHQPRSSLLAMIDAFVGPRWRDLYAHALAGEYRFLSFGDAMWLHRVGGSGGGDDSMRE